MAINVATMSIAQDYKQTVSFIRLVDQDEDDNNVYDTIAENQEIVIVPNVGSDIVDETGGLIDQSEFSGVMITINLDILAGDIIRGSIYGDLYVNKIFPPLGGVQRLTIDSKVT